MSKDMVGPLNRALVGVPIPTHGLLLDILHKVNMSTRNAEVFYNDLADFVRNWKPATATAMAIELLLEFVGAVTVPASKEKFIAREKFVCDTGHKDRVKISFVEYGFSDRFGNKVEDQMAEQILRYAKLQKSSGDRPIIIELGGVAKVETTLTEMFSLMEMQKNGESGVLLNNESANIFYIKDADSVLRTVTVVWFSDGWDVREHSIDSELVWAYGGQVFCRI